MIFDAAVTTPDHYKRYRLLSTPQHGSGVRTAAVTSSRSGVITFPNEICLWQLETLCSYPQMTPAPRKHSVFAQVVIHIDPLR